MIVEYDMIKKPDNFYNVMTKNKNRIKIIPRSKNITSKQNINNI